VINEQVTPFVDTMRNTPPVGTVVVDGAGARVVDEDLVKDSREAFWDVAREPLRLDEAAERATGARRTMTADLLREVADVHARSRMGLIEDELDPRLAVAHRFGISPSSASRWITKARDAGFLPPSGRARKQSGDQKS
jgi:hypothetical protein